MAMRNTGLGKHIAIIGGGPGGLMAAEVLATAGHSVTLYDRMPSLGRKFLMAGRGGLNLTHSEPLEKFLTRYGAASDWLAPYIRAFPPEALRAWCEGLGQQTYVGSSGRVFPTSMKAAPLLRAWLMRLNQLGVRYEARHHWQGWEGTALRFINAAQEKILVTPDATLLALGGASWPKLGSDGGWTDILSDAGVAISLLRPSNCGFIVPWSEHFSSRFAGSPLKSVVLTHRELSCPGDAMVTAQGLEGGVVYALSSSLRETILREGKAVLHIDLRPNLSHGELAEKLKIPRGSQSFSTHLGKAGIPPVVISLLREVALQAELNALTPTPLAALLKALPVTLTATAGLARAISTAGGIERGALTEDLMLKARPGVFAAGEMLDWEAPTGGYLLQGCFSTGVAAANGIMEFCSEHPG